MKKFENVKINITMDKKTMYKMVNVAISTGVEAKTIRYAINTLEYGYSKSMALGWIAGIGTSMAIDAGANGVKKIAAKAKEIKVKKSEKKEDNTQKKEELYMNYDGELVLAEG